MRPSGPCSWRHLTEWKPRWRNDHAVWEKVCAEVFDNKLNTTLGQLKMSTPLAEQYKTMQKKTLIEIIVTALDKSRFDLYENIKVKAAKNIQKI